MQVTTFDDGFRYELANRDFARIAMTRLRSRTRGRPEAEFWGTTPGSKSSTLPFTARPRSAWA